MRSKNVKRRCGAFSTHSRFRFVEIWVEVVFTTGDSPVTVTVSCSVLTLSCAVISTAWPSGTTMPSRFTLENPARANDKV
jgi:hypothetical protein